MINHYDTLGVAQSAELEVIRAAFRALAKKYHPDTFSGEKSIAEEKIREINQAFEILSDPKTRKSHDAELKRQNSSSGFESYDDFEKETAADNVLAEDWSTLIEVFPEAENIRKDLSLYSNKLAFSFQIILLSTKSAASAEKIGAELKKDFLGKFFGKNSKLQNLAELCLVNGKRHIANELNKKVALLGSEASDRIIQDIYKKYQSELEIIDPHLKAEKKKQNAERRAKQERSKSAKREEKTEREKYEANQRQTQSEARASEHEIARARRGSKFFFWVMLSPVIGLVILIISLLLENVAG